MEPESKKPHPLRDQRRWAKSIADRIDYLNRQIESCSLKAKSYHKRERLALIWADGLCKAELERLEKQTGDYK